MLKTETAQLSTSLLSHHKVVAGIPCLNTQNHIAEVVARAKKYVDEVIVIDDGSTDMTAEAASLAGATVIRHGINKGYGEAIKSCFSAANDSDADILVIIDGDGQHNPDEIPYLLAPVLQKEAAMVIGSRLLQNRWEIPPYRRLGIEVINWLWNLGVKEKISDTQSGFRVYNKKIIGEMNLSGKGMSISIEILEKIRKKKQKIKEIPISCSYENNNSNFSWKALRHGVSVAGSVIVIRLQSII
jgi:glycosyltransferase involved in cell wall biosynthesis